jgi:hypothetical protein
MAAQAGDPAIQFAQLGLQAAGLCAWCSRGRDRASTIPGPAPRPVAPPSSRARPIRFPAEKILQALVQFQRFGKQQAGVECEDGKFNPACLARCIITSPAPLKAGADGRRGPKRFQAQARISSGPCVMLELPVQRRHFAVKAGIAGWSFGRGLHRHGWHAASLQAAAGAAAPASRTRWQKSPNRSAPSRSRANRLNHGRKFVGDVLDS